MAELIVKKKYTNTLQYLTDVAKSTGVYNEEIANDYQSGAAYTSYLASLKLKNDEKTLSTIGSLDLSNLGDGTSKFSYILYRTGEYSDEKFLEDVDDREGFLDEFGSVEGYYTAIRDLNSRKARYDNMNVHQKRLNGLLYTAGQTISATLGLIEGFIDAHASLVGAVGELFAGRDSAFAENVKSFIGKDLTYFRDYWEEWGRDNAFWDDQNHWSV